MKSPGATHWMVSQERVQYDRNVCFKPYGSTEEKKNLEVREGLRNRKTKSARSALSFVSVEKRIMGKRTDSGHGVRPEYAFYAVLLPSRQFSASKMVKRRTQRLLQPVINF